GAVRGRGGGVDLEPPAERPNGAGGLRRRLVDRPAEEAVARDVEPFTAAEPIQVELLGAELGRDAPIREHRPLAVGADERHDDAVASLGPRAGPLHPAILDLARGDLPGRVRAALADEPSLCADRHRPGGDVRGLAACADERPRPALVGRRCRLLLLPDDDIEEQVAERADTHRADFYTGGMDEDR